MSRHGPATTVGLEVDDVNHGDIHTDTESEPASLGAVNLVVTKPKTAWCQSHIQRQPVEEDKPAEADEFTPEQSLPIHTPLLDDEDDTSGEASSLDEAVAMAVGAPTPPLQRG